MQCLERHSTPWPPVGSGWLSGVCGCFFDRFVGGFGGGVTPGPFPNPVAKPTCADGTAPGRVWESRSPPALNIVGGPVPALVDLWSVGVGAGPPSFCACAQFSGPWSDGMSCAGVSPAGPAVAGVRRQGGPVGRIHPADAHPQAGPVAARFSALVGRVRVPADAGSGGGDRRRVRCVKSSRKPARGCRRADPYSTSRRIVRFAGPAHDGGEAPPRARGWGPQVQRGHETRHHFP